MFRNDMICGDAETSIRHTAACCCLNKNAFLELEQRCKYSAAVAACLGLTVMLLVRIGALVYASVERDEGLKKQEWCL
jgi:hypothetical protein